jgi:small subunit ribosomal protein S20
VARIKSAVKNFRKSRRRNTINRARRSQLRTQIKKLKDLLDRKDAEGARGALSTTVSVIDRSRRKGMLHRNTAARYKSRLSRRVTALGKAR